MTIKNFIERAIDGGWHNGIKPARYEERYVYWGDIVASPENHMFYYSEILLDPLAWQAVGKVEGWGESYFHIKAKSTDYESFTYDECWKMNMHRFVGFLCDGLTLEEALEKATS